MVVNNLIPASCKSSEGLFPLAFSISSWSTTCSIVPLSNTFKNIGVAEISIFVIKMAKHIFAATTRMIGVPTLFYFVFFKNMNISLENVG